MLKGDNMSQPIFQAPGVQIYGDVRFNGEGISLWPNCVLRAEVQHIEIGAYTNVQDMCMLHIADTPTVIGEYCSLTHHCTIHGATIGNHCLIGINATIMDGAVIGDNCIVAGHSIVREGTVIPPNSIVAGVPGKVVASRDNRAANHMNAVAYYENGVAFARGYHRRWSDEDYLQQMGELAQSLGLDAAG